jgi:hypothetical protein
VVVLSVAGKMLVDLVDKMLVTNLLDLPGDGLK